jgi:DNA-binding transcriptional ArsR family regulator
MAAVSKDPTDLLFRALASRPRREILQMLASASTQEAGSGCCGSPHDVCACTFSEQLGLSPATVSHHMTILRDAGLVVGRKDGLWVYYRIRLEALGTLLDTVSALCPGTSAENARASDACA